MADDTGGSPPSGSSGPSPFKGGASGTFGFLTQKWGPMPAFVWIGAVGAIVYIGLKFKDKLTGAAPAAAAAGAPSAIDPNSGQPWETEAIDPATGASYGSEYAAAQQDAGQADIAAAVAAASGSNPPYTSTTYASNDQWSNAAVNYLESLGYGGTAATQAVQDYLAGTSLNQTEEPMVNAALKQLGSPPTQPTPSGGATTPKVNVPSVVGQPLTTAEQTLKTAGFTYTVTGGATTGTVSAQSPVGGSTVATASQVVLTVGTPASDNIKNAKFYTVTSKTTWTNVAKAENIFGGNGQALYQYNLLPGKHDPEDFANVRKTAGGNIPAKPGFSIAIPVRGQKVTLPVVGVVTS